MEAFIKSCKMKSWCHMDGVISINRDWETVVELEGYLNIQEEKEEIDYLFIDLQLMDKKSLINNCQWLIDSISKSKEVFISSVHVASPITNSLKQSGKNLIPTSWPKRNYKLIHQVHHFDINGLNLPDNVTPIFYDLHLNHFKSLIQQYPYKTDFVWLREGNFRDVWRMADMTHPDNRNKIFLVPNRYGIHKSREKVKTIIEENCLFNGYYSALDRRKMHDVDSIKLEFLDNYLLGMLNDPLINNFFKFVPYENRIDNGNHTSIPISAVFNNNNNQWISANLVHIGYYENTFISVCCESVEQDDCVITEKTLMPLAHGHFVLPIGAPGIISALKSKGFLFPNFIDYSYDEIKDLDFRIEKFGEEFNRLITIELDEWREYHKKNIDILHHNRKIFFKPYDKLGL